MREEVYGNYQSGYQRAVRMLAEGDPQLMADCSGAYFDENSSIFQVNYFNSPYLISYPEGIITAEKWRVNDADRQILPYYLAQASGLPLRGKWLSFMQLPGGPHHYAPFKQEAINPLAKKFGNDLGGFVEVAKAMGGAELDSGDIGFSVPALPKIPLGVMIWRGDSEFSPSANIVFDASATTYLTTDTLYLLGIQLAQKMRSRI